MLLTRKMPSFSGVGAGQTATCRLPIGLSYHHLLLTYAGATLAQLNELRVVANGEVIHRYVGGSVLDTLNLYEGRAAAGGILVLDFDRYNLNTRDGREFTRLGTGLQVDQDPRPISTLNLEVDIDAGAVGTVLSLKAVQSAPSQSGLFKKVRHFTYNAPAAGDYEIADLPRGDLINKVYFNKAGINSIKIERNGFVIFERTAAENTLIQTDGVRVPQTNYFVFDPTESGYGAEGLVTADTKDLRFTVNVAASGAIPVTVEYIGPLEV